MTEKTLFAKIIDREIEADICYEDSDCLAFHDVNPQAPVHVLVVPKEPIARLAEVSESHEALLGKLMLTATKVAKELGIEEAYRVVVNSGAGAGQSVFHLHIHVLGGRAMLWPPG